MNIAFFGAGYVGLVSGVCFAEMGNMVTCVDLDEKKVTQLKNGGCPIFEPGLDGLLASNLNAKRIAFTLDAKLAVETADIIFIAVGTPPEEDGSADLSYVLQVAKTIASHMNGYKVIVNKSTVPVGTVDKVKKTIAQGLMKRGVQIEFDVVSNPEFLKEGAAIDDCLKPDRIVIGSQSTKAISMMQQLYAPFNRNYDKLMIMDPRSAEMTKYVANAMLATKISFMNEMSQISRRLGADIEQVRRGIGADQRIGYDFIYPGCGYGGSCFPKDVKALRHMAFEQQYQPRMLNAVCNVNADQKKVLFQKINNFFKGNLQGKTIAIWGVAFKPKTDDIREASSRVLIEQLWQAGASVRLYDPEALGNFKAVYGEQRDYICCDSMTDALAGADVLAICTEWQCFRSPDFNNIKSLLKHAAIFDGRNVYDPAIVQQKELMYFSIGRCLSSMSIRENQLEGVLD